MGPAESDDHQIRILNRVVTCTEEGIEYEPDQRHAEIIIDHMGLSEKDKSIGRPCEDKEVSDSPEVPLTESDATKYRGLVARGIYLSQDRSDIGYGTKELARKMARPEVEDMGG